ncbi:MAG: DUF3127 domain-containing protein [Bacteroidota bacterium]|nr:DUF3127 domain-containing protein [Bacteroidota bacterium]
MSFELNGRLYEKYDTVSVSDKFRKREFVVEKTESTNAGEFTELIKFQLTQDRCDSLDRFNLNEEVKVSFNIRGRKWEKDGRVSYFTNLEAWRIEKVAPENAASPAQIPGVDFPDFEAGSDSDLPF